MLYREFLERKEFSKLELLALAKGRLLDDPPQAEMAQLPSPPFLMFDRITLVERGTSNGRIVAVQDIVPDAWYFQCHFHSDPVQPGCLGLDAVWQLLGFYCMVNGAVGTGRALGVGEVDFFGQIRPFDREVEYDVKIRRLKSMASSGSSIVIGDADVKVDGQLIYTIKGARVGCFSGIAYTQYPDPNAPHARGGVIDRSK